MINILLVILIYLVLFTMKLLMYHACIYSNSATYSIIHPSTIVQISILPKIHRRRPISKIYISPTARSSQVPPTPSSTSLQYHSPLRHSSSQYSNFQQPGDASAVRRKGSRPFVGL
ncbi:hypothetical protein CPB84DRAFT_653578 [Gymnopilus junonius]|uniref:Uncharacterized protein n=1 Tax=Gymnopilus junonius TaxID=109634 RepID=A0A9P5TP51_GYMJU|nr:hypothetical protein CPB84DRAFT_653578 [Gymnopilus junonius]